MKGDEHIRAVYAAWKARNGYRRDEAAQRTHIKPHTLDRRLNDPGSMTIAELRQLISANGSAVNRESSHRAAQVSSWVSM